MEHSRSARKLAGRVAETLDPFRFPSVPVALPWTKSQDAIANSLKLSRTWIFHGFSSEGCMSLISKDKLYSLCFK